MQWESWSAFFNMGGYAFYVWFSFGLTALCMVWEVIALRKRRAEALRLTQLLAQD
ncbi:heme exporter protein CcmD [Methylotenera sp.]|uniref:heme exporter protein CcmD n=1 Tax=Methylotenera sp. TaxID=2051956 RepID=UPI00271FEF62|nr:heme exporter protein CcmD [Methylotenera sp.]MDO9205581.1 heme exporter protein CcmD [Methylotenera sp.]MDO9392790.1 heme exporter protein CcmD [Methylotenera sp.]MDP1523184.1 heme exporter protein CcmD [Methylotenera sp.]MDP2070079.1 heme exporter protein CcmD [Methylotenera sp.]MDP2229997.1 heme exporter protein CcmD [Methylotenera sp.]